jgi:hypothetical protein
MQDMSTLIDLDNWANDLEVLNSAVKWMGYKQCQFNEFVMRIIRDIRQIPRLYSVSEMIACILMQGFNIG